MPVMAGHRVRRPHHQRAHARRDDRSAQESTDQVLGSVLICFVVTISDDRIAKPALAQHELTPVPDRA